MLHSRVQLTNSNYLFPIRKNYLFSGTSSAWSKLSWSLAQLHGAMFNPRQAPPSPSFSVGKLFDS
jgi:hypothetical protein